MTSLALDERNCNEDKEPKTIQPNKPRDYLWLDDLINDAFRYDFNQGPRQVRSLEDAKRAGINCVALAHVAIKRLFGLELDAALHCYELFNDRQHFAEVGGAPLQPGDLVWFGCANPSVSPSQFSPQYDETGYLLNWRDFAVNHVAIYTGEEQDGEPLLLHASPTDGTNAIWPLGKFAEYPRYEHIYRISRLALDSA